MANFPIIQSFWTGAPLSNMEKLCIQSFLGHGHEFHLYTYADIGGIPSGATVKDCNEILPESEIFTYKGGSYAGFSNWFRYALLFKRSGFWVDMDCICIKPFQFDSDIVFASRIGGFQCCVMSLPAQHELAGYLDSVIRDMDDKTRSPRGSTGPSLFDRAVRKFKLEAYGKPYLTFIPISSQNLYYIFDDSYAGGIDLPSGTHCVHIWNSLVARQNIKDARFDSNSLFEQLKAKHGIANLPNAEYISSKKLYAIIEASKAADLANRKNRIKREQILCLLVGFVLGIIAGLIF